VDILLCAVAIKRQWTIFTTDPDFSNYAKVLPLRIRAPEDSDYDPRIFLTDF
jgi:hypothetical protein